MVLHFFTLRVVYKQEKEKDQRANWNCNINMKSKQSFL